MKNDIELDFWTAEAWRLRRARRQARGSMRARLRRKTRSRGFAYCFWRMSDGRCELLSAEAHRQHSLALYRHVKAMQSNVSSDALAPDAAPPASTKEQP